VQGAIALEGIDLWDNRARIQAADILLDRGRGKPSQPRPEEDGGHVTIRAGRWPAHLRRLAWFDEAGGTP
jgi:hypothetical protein